MEQRRKIEIRARKKWNKKKGIFKKKLAAKTENKDVRINVKSKVKKKEKGQGRGERKRNG